MRIAIEALGIHRYGGGRSVALNLLQALLHIDRRHEYLMVLSQPEPSLTRERPAVRQWIAPVQDRVAVRLWAQLALPLGLADYDLIHFVKDPGIWCSPTRTVMTVHDLTVLIRPDLFPWLDVWYWRYVQGHTLRTLDRVVAVSQATASDIAHYYHVASDRIRVIYNACATHFLPSPTGLVRQAREHYGLPEQYIIHVGRIDRKKNLSLLLRAVARLTRGMAANMALVLVGEPDKKNPDRSLGTTIDQLGLRRKVIMTGPVPDAHLPALYSGALAAVLPSFHEGFGLMALEAMACGTPLIVGRTGALPEVVGEAALLVDDLGEAGPLADAIASVLESPALRATLRERGLVRARDFRWDDAARDLLQLYDEVVGLR